MSQLSLFGGGVPRVAEDQIGPLKPRRHWLDATAWLDHAPGFLQGHETLLSTLQESVTWVEQRREMFDKVVAVPRLMGKMDHPPPLLVTIGKSLSARYGVPFDSVTFSLYRNGRDSVAYHGDRGAREVGRSHVVTLSLGARRRFSVRPRVGENGERQSFDLGSGDLMVMGGACQRTWEHAVTKVAAARAEAVGPRLVVMYRASSEWEHTDVNLDARTMPERMVREVRAHQGRWVEANASGPEPKRAKATG